MISTERKTEGFWYSKEEPKLPKPIPHSRAWPGKKDFLKCLDAKEETAARDYYKGYSRCRICNKLNGTATYRSDKWCWPSGFRHYVSDHNVRPTDDFIKFIMGKAKYDLLKGE